jgi:hypothetical protein
LIAARDANNMGHHQAKHDTMRTVTSIVGLLLLALPLQPVTASDSDENAELLNSLHDADRHREMAAQHQWISTQQKRLAQLIAAESDDVLNQTMCEWLLETKNLKCNDPQRWLYRRKLLANEFYDGLVSRTETLLKQAYDLRATLEDSELLAIYYKAMKSWCSLECLQRHQARGHK